MKSGHWLIHLPMEFKYTTWAASDLLHSSLCQFAYWLLQQTEYWSVQRRRAAQIPAKWITVAGRSYWLNVTTVRGFHCQKMEWSWHNLDFRWAAEHFKKFKSFYRKQTKQPRWLNTEHRQGKIASVAKNKPITKHTIFNYDFITIDLNKSCCNPRMDFYRNICLIGKNIDLIDKLQHFCTSCTCVFAQRL